MGPTSSVTIERTHAAIPAAAPAPVAADGSLTAPDLYINRELSWLGG